jgi:hypothetical protein
VPNAVPFFQRLLSGVVFGCCCSGTLFGAGRPFFAPSPAVGFAAEIGDEIVSMLERRLAALRGELEKLGGEDHGQAHD